MKILFNKHSERVIFVILAVLLLAVIILIWYFTSQNGQLSHSMSIPLAEKIRNILSDNLLINKNYICLNRLDELVRKGAHFCEYMLLGSITCLFFSVLFRKVWFSTFISLFVCSFYAFIDEYRQNFIPGRTFLWFDWKLDLAGAVSGIIMTALIVLIIFHIHKLKERIYELEGVLEQKKLDT
jgi:VanZ family protein